MRKIQRGLMTSAAMMATIVATSGAARAQAEAQPAAKSSAQGSAQAKAPVQLEEVTVTATRRPERLQDVPIAVTALTKDVLEQNNVRELGDLVNLSPALQITYGSQPGNFAIAIRGIGTFSNGIAVESDAAVVVDDVPFGLQAQAFKDLIDVDRIEVLKGPQSTLFGKSAISGVLNITTAEPTNTLTGRVTATATNDNEKRLGFTVSGPIADGLKFRLTVADSSFPGLLHNLTDDKNVGGSAGFTATGKLEWRPIQDLTLSLEPRFNRNHSTCCESPISSLVSSAPGGGGLFYQGLKQEPESVVLKGIDLNNRWNTDIRTDDEPGGGNSEAEGVTARVKYQFGDASPLNGHTLQSISSVDYWHMHDYQDIDGTDVPFLLYWPLAHPSGIDSGASIHGQFHNKSLTQEFRLTSPNSGRLHYVAGLWYNRNDGSRELLRGPVLSVANYSAASTNINYAAFANATFDVTDKLSLDGGVRYNHQYINYQFFNFIKPVGDINRHLFGANDEPAVTDTFSVKYKWTPDIMTYATYATGYKGQAYDLVSSFTDKESNEMPVKHETAKSIEAGVKTSLFNRRVYFNADVFNVEYYGFQTSVTSFLPDGTFLTFLQSIGQLQTRGVEADAKALVTRNFTVYGSLAYDEATVVRWPNGGCYGGEPAAPAGSPIPAPPGYCYSDGHGHSFQNLAGRTLANSPLVKFNLGGEYYQPLAGLPFQGYLAATYRWQSDLNFSVSQDPVSEQKSYGIANLNVGIRDNNRRYRFVFFVNNLLDQHYANGLGNTSSGFSAPGLTAHGTVWSVPRDAFRYFGGRLDFSF